MMFNNVDVSNLLCEMERLHSEVCALRHAVKFQADIGEDLYTVTTTTDSRVAIMDRHLEPSSGGGHGLDVLGDAGGTCGRAPVRAVAVDNGVVLLAAVGVPGSFVVGDTTSVAPASVSRTELAPDVHVGAAGAFGVNGVSPGRTAALPNSPKWSHVVKHGRPMTTEGQSKHHSDKPVQRRP